MVKSWCELFCDGEEGKEVIGFLIRLQLELSRSTRVEPFPP